MKKSLIGFVILFVLLTTYTPKFNFVLSSNFFIQDVQIENNSILSKKQIKDKLQFIYKENLLFLDIDRLETNLKSETFIKSFTLKKVYPNKLKIYIHEKKPIAILINKKKKSYITNEGNFIDFTAIDQFKNLPMVFGGKNYFYVLYQNLKSAKIPITTIKSFYYFESGRWDLIMKNGKTVKLPIKDYLLSLENFTLSQEKPSFNKYTIFDYRIKNQLILN